MKEKDYCLEGKQESKEGKKVSSNSKGRRMQTYVLCTKQVSRMGSRDDHSRRWRRPEMPDTGWQ